MDPYTSLLLYSNYSSRSHQLLAALKSSPVDLSTVANMTNICIDNPDIRHRIVNSSNIHITTVPTILLVFNDGTVETYEGKQAFDWVEQAVYNHIPPQPAPKQVQIPEIPEIDEDDEDDEDDKIVVRPKRKSKPKHKPIISPVTNMEDLHSESEEEDDNTIKRPPIGLRSGAGNYTISNNDYGDMNETNRIINNNVRPKSETTATSGSTLMSQALAMQKDRE
jgi:outer membrane biosynthesis protein TonB